MKSFLIFAVFQFFAAAALAAGEAYNCADANANNAASISIGFDYDGTNREIPDMIPKLNNTGQDAAFYASFAGRFSRLRQNFYRDREVRSPVNGGKANLIKSIVADVGSARYVNINFSGHGVVMPNGEWGILLPNVPKDFLVKCVSQVDVGKGLKLRGVGTADFSKDCIGFKDYFLTGGDLQRALPGRKFFAAIDTCNSGAADFGPESVALTSALAGEVAGDGLGKNGVFTEAVDGVLNDCANDTNQNNYLDLNELLSHFIHTTDVTVNTKRNLRGTEGQITQLPNGYQFQHPGIVASKNLPWTSCFQLRHMPGKCGFHDSDDAGASGVDQVK
jgi:hypothetical protein